ncbi:MAG: 5'-nucleotidase C-terminal domain-containing protein [Bacteroidales bacterium]|nr:5'-nucleotidase C-terminal domain-containing protein [Bacteroidales bacterium]MCM1205776.1 5'-nucleotidase C-terminal domain-containing protein [Bacillota bacterium]MCM1511169.1 5'-nucleotidase C-terminal domain-containing protein [Clostridium sp.]
MKKYIVVAVVFLTTAISAFAQKYHVTNVTRERILIDSTFVADARGIEVLAPYKHIVDSIMSPVVGKVAKYMVAHNPESELSNLLADIMVWQGERYGEKPDLGIYNMGGIRAALPAGDVTFGDVNDVAPFENYIAFVSLTGRQMNILFDQIAKSHGCGLSKGIALVIKDRKVESVTLNGEPIDPNRTYRIVTLNYLAEGNDGFLELTKGFDIKSPMDERARTREFIVEYFLEKLKAGEVVDSYIEGRVVLK